MSVNEKLSREEWEKKYIQDMRSLEKKSSKIKALLELIDKEDKTPFQQRTLKNVFNSEYRAYSLKFDYEQSKNDTNSVYSKLFDVVKKEKIKSVNQTRKERAHELITIGALTDVVNFEKDRGLITGVLLDALERMKNNEQLKWDLKKRGDDLLHQIELENKKKKEERQTKKLDNLSEEK